MEREKIAESTLRMQFKMEMLVYSQDRTYSNSWSDNKKLEDETMIKKPAKTLYTVCVKDNKATLQELMLHLKSYYRVSWISDGHQIITELTFSFLTNSSDSSPQIATQRLGDQIPLVIRYHMLQEFAAELQRKMIKVLQDKSNMDNLLKENFDIGTTRAMLHSRMKRLMQARSYLVKF